MNQSQVKLKKIRRKRSEEEKIKEMFLIRRKERNLRSARNAMRKIQMVKN